MAPAANDAIVRVVPHDFDQTRENTPPGVVQASASLSPHARSDGVPPFAAPSEPTTDIASCHFFPPFVDTRAFIAPEPLETHVDPHGVPGGADADRPAQPLAVRRDRRRLADHAPHERLAPVVLRATRTCPVLASTHAT